MKLLLTHTDLMVLLTLGSRWPSKKMGGWMRYAIIATAFAVAFSTAAQADDLSDLKAQLEAATKSIQALQKRVQTLEAQKAEKEKAKTSAPVVVAKAPAPPTAASLGAPVVAPNEKLTVRVPGLNNARIEIQGAVQLDAIYDFKRMDPNWVSTLRPSKIPVNCPPVGTDPGCGKDGITNFSVRSSYLDFRGFLPTTVGELKTQLAFDLWGGADNGTTQLRLVHAWASLGPYLVGMTDSLFMDIDVFPNIFDFWGPSGMMFVRDPQIRWTPYNYEGWKFAVALEVPGGAIDAGKLTNRIPELANTFVKPRYPDITGQARVDGTWGHVQLAGVARWITFDNSLGIDGRPSGTVFGWGGNLSGHLNTFGQDAIRGQIAYGRGIAAYSNDCCFDLAPDPIRAAALPLLNWLAYYDHWWSPQWSSSIGFSQNIQDNFVTQFDTEQHQGAYASVNLVYYPMQNVKVGVEGLWGERVNKDGSKASDQRMMFSTQVKF